MEEIKAKYNIQQILGSGATCVVRKARTKDTHQVVAIKMISRESQTSMSKVKNQIQILTQLDHPNVINIYQIYEGQQGIFIVMEYMAGGQLYQRVAQRTKFSEQQVCNILRKLVDAVRYIHQMEIVHRDIKPQNMLLSTKDPDAVLKLADFGLSKIISDELLNTNCGTPVYMAPEILSGNEYGFQVDIWSVGVTMYYLLSGDLPFKGEQLDQLQRNIKNGTLQFPQQVWSFISFRAKNLIRKLLNIDPSQRPTAKQIIQDMWFIQMQREQELFEQKPFISLDLVVKKIKKHNMKKKLKRGINGVIALVKLKKVFRGQQNFMY